MTTKSLKFETLQIHAGQEPDQTTHSRAVPFIKHPHTCSTMLNMQPTSLL